MKRHPILPVVICVVALCASLGAFFALTQAPQPKAADSQGTASFASGTAPGAASAASASSATSAASDGSASAGATAFADVSDASQTAGSSTAAAHAQTQSPSAASQSDDVASRQAGSAEALRRELNISEDYRPAFVHGDKSALFQKYIVLHDTEGESDPWGVVDYWDGNGRLIAAHFVVGKDGSIVQCVPLDAIAHHAGFGDTGNNQLYGVMDESRDDKLGTTPIGDWAADYGMNSYSVGIEMVHVGGSGFYPEAQLQAVDKLIAYIDAYYGFESVIIDHKAWRTSNGDTSPEFAEYLANYQDHRTHL